MTDCIVGDIEFAAAEEATDLPGEYHHLGELLRKVLPELGELYCQRAQTLLRCLLGGLPAGRNSADRAVGKAVLPGARRSHRAAGQAEPPDPHGGRMTTVHRRAFLTLTASGIWPPPKCSQTQGSVVAMRSSSTRWVAWRIPTRTADRRVRNSGTTGRTAPVMREAFASGLTAVNLTLGYVYGDGEPFEATIRDIANTDAERSRQSGGSAQGLYGCGHPARQG